MTICRVWYDRHAELLSLGYGNGYNNYGGGGGKHYHVSRSRFGTFGVAPI